MQPVTAPPDKSLHPRAMHSAIHLLSASAAKVARQNDICPNAGMRATRAKPRTAKYLSLVSPNIVGAVLPGIADLHGDALFAPDASLAIDRRTADVPSVLISLGLVQENRGA